MQSIRGVVLKNMRIKIGTSHQLFPRICRFSWIVMERGFSQEASSQNASENFNHLTNRVLGLVKKFGKIDSSKVTETADFQKDLCLDSLDRVELVMAFEQEFSIEIPDEKADKINCCADAVQYIASQLQCNIKEGSW